ncbi:MAG TPA: glycine-rich domain-containing protein-like [Telluria sp.]|nr:glycine-rich domain-containing protein-like [Telluria sp.]
MLSNDDFKAIAELDLDPIKVKLMHEESGEGWSLEKATAVEAEYRRFLILMKKFPEEQTAPLFDVDTFWHYHILDTMKYAEDCQRIFGYFLHHFPYIGLRGEEDEAAHERVGQRMKELYEETFGEPYIKGEAAYSGVAAQAAGAEGKVAYSGVAAKTAYSGVANGKVAYSGVAAKTAYSGVAAESKVAYSGVAAKTAYSGVANKTAYSGADAKFAYSGVNAQPGANVDKFYTVRPTLSKAA